MELKKDCYTLKELAELFAVKHSTLATSVTRNPSSLPKPIRVGRQLRFTKGAILTFLENQKG